MLEHEPPVRSYPAGQKRRRGLRWPRIAAVLVLIIFLASLAGGGVLYARPLPHLSSQPVSLDEVPPAASVNMPWPSYGQSAVGLAGGGILATSSGATGAQPPLPTASVAKTMTALAVLDKKPLKPGETGPTITLTAKDKQIYDWYFARGGSLAAMQEGEQINQYDALEALMLPSANNFADTLAIWAYGSMENYTKAANAMAKSFGMDTSNFDDASGFSPRTVSTADDLVRLGDRALRNPVLAEIIAKRTAQIPVAGTIYNVNGLLGKYGINGIKTGNTDEAGGVFLVSAERKLANGKTGTVIACVMGGPNLEAAMLATLPLLDATAANVVDQTVVKKGQAFGTYQAPWSSEKVQAVAKHDVIVSTWKDSRVKVTASLKSLDGPQAAGIEAGTAKVTAGAQTNEVPLVLEGSIGNPSWWWRVSR